VQPVAPSDTSLASATEQPTDRRILRVKHE
jgi:hypothetical protein